MVAGCDLDRFGSALTEKLSNVKLLVRDSPLLKMDFGLIL